MRQLGFVGLGKMGKGIVYHLLEQGVEVVVWNRSKDDVEEVAKAGAIPAADHKELVSKLTTPRVIWIMVPAFAKASAGKAQLTPVDEMVKSLLPHLSPGDLIIDGGNSFYKDTLRRSKVLASKGILLWMWELPAARLEPGRGPV